MRTVLLAIMVPLLSCCGGCLVWPERFIERVPDSDTKTALPVKQATAGSVSLTDGRTLAYAGLDLRGLKPRHLRSLAGPVDRTGGGGPGMLWTACYAGEQACFVQMTAGDKAYVVLTNHRWPVVQESFWPLFPLIPVPVWEWRHPVREDLALDAIRSGLANASPDDLAGITPLASIYDQKPPSLAELKQAYVSAEAEARKLHLGIHRTPDEELFDACGPGKPELSTIDELLAEGADPSRKARYRPAIEQAAVYGSPEVLQRLLRAAPQANATALLETSVGEGARAKSGTYRLLLGHGATIRDHAISAQLLVVAARDNDDELASKLLALGANPNWQTKDGDLPLNIAVYHGSDRVAERLLAAGADPRSRNRFGHGDDALTTLRRRDRKDSRMESLLQEGRWVTDQFRRFGP